MPKKVVQGEEMFFRDDIQTIEYFSLPGDDSAPVVGSKVIIVSLGAFCFYRN